METDRWRETCHALWTFEQNIASGVTVFAGVDEVGRGCLAGPVVAAAVVLGGQPDDWVGIRDSKLLAKRRREQLHKHISDAAHAVAVGMATVEEIDEWNILGASRVAMGRAIAKLQMGLELVLVDGPYGPVYGGQSVRAIPVIDGDAKCLSIAAASVVAKVERDAIMADLAQHYPAYGFERNAGYGTSEHLQALRMLGPTPHHRASFAPVKALLEAR